MRRSFCNQRQCEGEDRKATKEQQTPKGFHSEAQGKRSAALGCGAATIPTPTGLYIQEIDEAICMEQAEPKVDYRTLSGFGIGTNRYPGWRFADPGLRN